MEKDTAKQGIIKGAMILAAASFISKIVGMLYRIPVTNILGDAGNGIYSQAYNIYAMLLTLSAVGIPSAISKLISERIAVGAYKDAQRVHKIAMIYSTIVASVLAIGMWVGAGCISNLMVKNASLTMPIKALAPTIIVVTIMAVMRGYFQGMNNMAPSGISQVIEQIVNAIFSVVLAYLFIGKGVEAAATGSTVGTGLGAVAGLLFMVFIYCLINEKMKKRIAHSKAYTYQSSSKILKIILITTIPIVISTSVFSLMTNIDSFMIARMLPRSINYLQNHQLLEGLPITGVMEVGRVNLELGASFFVQANTFATDYMKYRGLMATSLTSLESVAQHTLQNIEITKILVGQYFGKYFTLVNVPVSLILTMGTAAIPSIAMATSLGDMKEVKKKTRMILKIGMLLAVPAAIGLALFGKPIMAIIFSSEPDGGELLAYGAISIIFITIAQLTTGVLQGMGKQQVPTVNAIIACLIKVVFNVILLSLPTLHIYAVIHSTTICYMIYAFLNVVYLKRYLNMRFNWKVLLIKPCISGAIMGSISYGLYRILCLWIPKEKLWLMLIIPVAAGIYGLVGLATGAITRRDLENIPGGKKIMNRLF